MIIHHIRLTGSGSSALSALYHTKTISVSLKFQTSKCGIKMGGKSSLYIRLAGFRTVVVNIIWLKSSKTIQLVFEQITNLASQVFMIEWGFKRTAPFLWCIQSMAYVYRQELHPKYKQHWPGEMEEADRKVEGWERPRECWVWEGGGGAGRAYIYRNPAQGMIFEILLYGLSSN